MNFQHVLIQKNSARGSSHFLVINVFHRGPYGPLEKQLDPLPEFLRKSHHGADPEIFARGGPTVTTFYLFLSIFLVDEGYEDPNTTISRSSSAFRWRADDDPALNLAL